MNIKPSYYRGRFDSNFCHVIKSRNDLKVDRIEYIKDFQRGQLVILLECDLHLKPEINAFIKGETLILEGPLSMDYGKPFRIHLIKNEAFSDYEKEGMEIGFSEVQLDNGFKYVMLSSQLLKPGLIKVILSFQRNNKHEATYN